MRSILLCPFTAANLVWQAQNGAWTLTVAVRATFSLVHGREAVLADTQEPLVGDRHYDDDPRQSLYCAGDLALYKPRADVVLVGSAFAPDHVAVDALLARLSLGELDKSLGVIGDRTWVEGPDGLEPSPPTPFVSMPLRYERAARGRDNPIGFDLTRAPTLGALALPNLESADDDIGAARTVGFGPIAPSAPARRALLAPEHWAWIEGGYRGQAPAGFDFAFFNAAPRDQQIEAVHDGASLLLENMSRPHRKLTTRLPGVRPKAFLVPDEMDRGAEIALRCDTVWIDTDRALLTLTWRGVLTVPTADEEDLGAIVVAAESKGHSVTWAQIEKLLLDGSLGVTTDGDPLAETNRIPARREPALRSAAPERRAAAPIVPTLAPAPVLIQTGTSPNLPPAREPASTPLWDELSSSDLFEVTSTDEPRTLQRPVIEDSLTEEPSTSPLLERPPTAPAVLGAPDYARIAAAMERGDAARILFEYGLSLPDLPRLTREWTERGASDPGFAAAFAHALSTARRRP